MAAEHQGEITLEQLGALVDGMRERHVARVRLPSGLEVELHQTAFAPARVEEKYTPEPIGVENGGAPTEEQLLYWSAGGPLPKARKGDES
jgi:hypothetical protein